MSEYTVLVEDSKRLDRLLKCLDQLDSRGSCRFEVGGEAYEVRAYMVDESPAVLLCDLRLIIPDVNA